MTKPRKPEEVQIHKDGRYFIVRQEGKKWLLRPGLRGFYWFAFEAGVDERIGGSGYTIFEAIKNAMTRPCPESVPMKKEGP